MKRLPRKLKKKIPKGMYCYAPIKFDISTNIYYIRKCPHYKYIDGIEGMCRLFGYEVIDQCKSCSIRLGF